MFRVIGLDKADTWDAVTAGADVFYLSGYARILAENGEGEPHLFLYECERGTALQVSLRRPIGQLPFAERDYDTLTDLVTPYGYGGPILHRGDPQDASALVNRLREHIAGFCRHEHVVSEFIRFHPLLANAQQASPDDAEVEVTAETVYLDLSASDEQLLSQMKPANRNKIRKSLNHGVTIDVGGREYLDDLVTLYTSTMARRGADEYYLFSRRYFESFFEYLPDNAHVFVAKYRGEVVVAALVLRSCRLIHYHLSGSQERDRQLGANNLLLFEIARWGRQAGAACFHLGGGYQAGDSLFAFKAGFSGKFAAFCIGRKIYDRATYNLLVRDWKRFAGHDVRGSFFPAYRQSLPAS